MSQSIFYKTIDAAADMLFKTFRHFEVADSGDEDRFVPILISRPGLGKSAVIAKQAKKHGYELIDLNLACIEPTDIIGLGAREKVEGRWETSPALPTWTKKALAGNCIILTDEFNNTSNDVLAGFQKMFSDFVIDGIKLPRTTHIIGACNPPGKDAIYAAKKLSGAFRRRLCMIPVYDDFEYVASKHNFVMPNTFRQTMDNEDLANYIQYDGLSSAVIDNIFNIVKYDSITHHDKATLINGFGEMALHFCREMKLLPEEAYEDAKRIYNEEIPEISYSEWKKKPGDQVSEYQQIIWGQHSIKSSSSYSRSKKFVSRVTNPNVYVALLEVLKEAFEVEYEVDSTKLPDSRTIAKAI